MSRVFVVQSEAVTALGKSIEETWQGLVQGLSAVQPVERFRVECYNSTQAACISDLQIGPEGSRIDPLLEHLVHSVGKVPSETELFFATTKGAVDLLEHRLRHGQGQPLETIVPRVLAERFRGMLGGEGQVQVVSAACASSTIALARAAALIRAGRTKCAAVGCADLVSEFVFSGFSALRALSPEPCRPFDRSRTGLTLGEGAAFFLLMSEGRMRKEQRVPLAEMVGWGTANDATHITAPARDGCGLVAAMQAALAVAGLSPDQIGGICAHGTGTVYNDAMELTAINRLFGLRRLPVFSVKGALGHTLGAAGGIEAAVLLECLQRGTVPPTIGLVNPEEGAASRISSMGQETTGEWLMTTNSGFGGVNCAVVLKKAGDH
jgi:3-oxoacyl-[acyl-carrier-protein] synthase II